MARRAARRSTRGRSSYSAAPRRRTYRSAAPRRVSRRGGPSASGRTVRIEVVTVPASPVARPNEFGVMQQPAAAPRKRQF